MAEREADLYAVLGADRGASADQLKKTYRQLAKKYHPDVNPGNKQAEEKFKEVSAAFEVLSDPKRRALYDEFGADSLRSGFDEKKAEAYRQWKRGGPTRGGVGGAPPDLGGWDSVDLGGGMGSFDFGSIFGEMFGGGRRGRAGRTGGGPGGAQVPSGNDIEATLEVELTEAARGGERDLGVEDRTLRVKIPSGVVDGSKIRLAGQGAPSPYGGAAGDLLLTVKLLPHSWLRREGKDLSFDLPVTVTEAVAGAEVTVPTFDGPVRLRVPAGSQSGTQLRLKGRGLPDLKSKGTDARGDLYAVLKIVLPEASEALGQIAEQLGALYKGDPRRGLAL